MKRIVFIGIAIAISALVVASTVALVLPRIEAGLRPLLLQHMANQLTGEERKAMYQRIAQGTNFWDAVPDPDLAGLGQPHRTVTDAGAEVRINNAGLRSAKDYAAKREGTFRILCLGDSFVFGMGGLEEDRFCDQMEAFYHEQAISVGSQSIETYAIGLPGWTLVQETTYLTRRISSYDPDLIIVLSVANDITDNFGVTGAGTLTYTFSPEHRELGSAVYTDDLNRFFRDEGPRSALSADLSPASRARWDKAMQRLKLLVDLQRARGKRTLVSAMTWGRTDQPDGYATLFQHHFLRLGISAPLVLTSFLPGRRTRLAHDGHPNRLGHGLLRDQYVHALNRLGWVTVPDSVLPDLDRRTPVRINPAPDTAAYETFRTRFVDNLGEMIDFGKLRPEQSRGFIGGVFPESRDPAHAVEATPWASLRATFLLRRPQARPLQGVEVEIEIPARPELFPFSLKLLLDGAPAAEWAVQHPNANGRYRISGAPVIPAFYAPAVEIALETSSYFNTIDDTRMKSYRLVRARAF